MSPIPSRSGEKHGRSKRTTRSKLRTFASLAARAPGAWSPAGQAFPRWQRGLRERNRRLRDHFNYAYAAGRYSQRISVAKALAQGYGGRIRAALETTLALEPRYAEAHVALGAYHAEIIDKIGALVGGLTYGARRVTGEEHYRKAIKLAPDSPIAHIEMANGLVMMHGRKMIGEAGKLYAKAAAIAPRDAMEVLDVEAAKGELE
jgi:tetratricopeptide (TPR) repeat protein